jgi:hypothetical protein
LEYRVIEEASQPGVLERRLNELAREGWRIVGQAKLTPPYRVVLEREASNVGQAFQPVISQTTG